MFMETMPNSSISMDEPFATSNALTMLKLVSKRQFNSSLISKMLGIDLEQSMKLEGNMIRQKNSGKRSFLSILSMGMLGMH